MLMKNVKILLAFFLKKISNYSVRKTREIRENFSLLDLLTSWNAEELEDESAVPMSSFLYFRVFGVFRGQFPG